MSPFVIHQTHATSHQKPARDYLLQKTKSTALILPFTNSDELSLAETIQEQMPVASAGEITALFNSFVHTYGKMTRCNLKTPTMIQNHLAEQRDRQFVQRSILPSRNVHPIHQSIASRSLLIVPYQPRFISSIAPRPGIVANNAERTRHRRSGSYLIGYPVGIIDFFYSKRCKNNIQALY